MASFRISQRDHFELVDESQHLFGRAVLHCPNDHILAALVTAPALIEHAKALSDARGIAKEDLQAALGPARRRAGFAHYRWQAVYNVRIPRAQEILGEERTVHTAEHLASAVFYLGAPRVEIPPARLFASAPDAARPYAVIHPLASAPDKTWHAEGFLSAARFLRETLDLDPVFIAGPGESLDPFREYRTLAGAPLADIKSLMSGAALFLGNDSGPAHMAAAFGLPSVVIFGASDPAIWHPWRTPSEVIRSSAGIQSVTDRQVLDALERMRVHA